MLQRKAFTLIELLVVIAIIGMLVALLLPAVQAAREAARRAQCANQVKQIALAMHLHDSSLRILPDGGTTSWPGYFDVGQKRSMCSGKPCNAPKQNWGWAYQILPYIEQTNVWNLTDQDKVFGTAIPGYFCPTRRRPMLVASANPNTPPRAMIDYAGNAGADSTGNNNWGQLGNGKDGVIVRQPDGTANRSGSVGLADNTIRDGTTKTLLVGEKCLNVALLGQKLGDDDSGYIDGWDWDHIRWGRLPPTADWFNSDPATGDAGYVSLRGAFGSSHPGVFNAALCDGSVRSIAFDIDATLFQELSTRSDSKPLAMTDL